MKTVMVIIILERFKLTLQFNGVPEHHLIKKFTENGPYKGLNEMVRAGLERHHLTTVNLDITGLSNNSIVCLNRSFLTNAEYAFSVVLTEA